MIEMQDYEMDREWHASREQWTRSLCGRPFFVFPPPSTISFLPTLLFPRIGLSQPMTRSLYRLSGSLHAQNATDSWVLAGPFANLVTCLNSSGLGISGFGSLGDILKFSLLEGYLVETVGFSCKLSACGRNFAKKFLKSLYTQSREKVSARVLL